MCFLSSQMTQPAGSLLDLADLVLACLSCFTPPPWITRAVHKCSLALSGIPKHDQTGSLVPRCYFCQLHVQAVPFSKVALCWLCHSWVFNGTYSMSPRLLRCWSAFSAAWISSTILLGWWLLTTGIHCNSSTISIAMAVWFPYRFSRTQKMSSAVL